MSLMCNRFRSNGVRALLRLRDRLRLLLRLELLWVWLWLLRLRLLLRDRLEELLRRLGILGWREDIIWELQILKNNRLSSVYRVHQCYRYDATCNIVGDKLCRCVIGGLGIFITLQNETESQFQRLYVWESNVWTINKFSCLLTVMIRFIYCLKSSSFLQKIQYHTINLNGVGLYFFFCDLRVRSPARSYVWTKLAN